MEQNADYVLDSGGQPALCDGEVCVNCNKCEKCVRTINATRHLDVCACPPDGKHWWCGPCLSKQVASILAPYERYNTQIDRSGTS